MKCDSISYESLLNKLDSYLNKVGYNKVQIEKNKSKTEEVGKIPKKILEKDIYPKQLIGQNSNAISNINPLRIHTCEITRKRGFFVKENTLKLFNFKYN